MALFIDTMLMFALSSTRLFPPHRTFPILSQHFLNVYLPTFFYYNPHTSGWMQTRDRSTQEAIMVEYGGPSKRRKLNGSLVNEVPPMADLTSYPIVC
jgi:hypothetical protein